MKRQTLPLLFGIVLSTAISGCLAGPGVVPPENIGENPSDAGKSLYRHADPGGTGSNHTQSSGENSGSGTSVTDGTTTGTKAGTGGSGGALAPSVDAAVADGAINIDSGVLDGNAEKDAEIDDDAGSEQ